jgi:secreted trypsin-like serine protease
MIYVSIAFFVAYSFLYLELVNSSPLQNDDRDLKNRIIGGTIANAQRYPYYTFIVITSQSGSRKFCGGSLVNPDVVLTAAHCIVNPLNPIVNVIALVNYTQSVDVTGFLTGFEHLRSGIAFRVHGNYDSIRVRNDIGLVYLDSPVNEVTPVNLNDNGNMPADGDPVSVFGHGRISNAEPAEFPNYLMEVSVPIVPFQDCNDRNSYLGSIVEQSMICAGASSGGYGVCHGDSGGPLIILGNSATQDIQVGIASFVSKKGCSIVNYPSVFTRVSNYRQWIQDLICLYSNVKPMSCSNVTQPTSTPTSMPVITNPPTSSAPINMPVVTNPPTPTSEPTKMPEDTNPPTLTPTSEPTNPPTLTPTSESTNKSVDTNPPTATKKPEITKTPTRKTRPTFRPTPAPSGRSKAPTRNPTVKKKKITPSPTPSPSKPSLSRNLYLVR